MIIFRLHLCSHLFCRGFIFHYFCIPLSILLSISSGSVTAYRSRVHNSPLSFCSILNFLWNVLYICSIIRFSFDHSIVYVLFKIQINTNIHCSKSLRANDYKNSYKLYDAKVVIRICKSTKNRQHKDLRDSKRYTKHYT
jgi:hypothetical protein